MSELESKLTSATTKLKQDESNLENLRVDRAKLAIVAGAKNAPRIKKLDEQIDTTRTDITNGKDIVEQLQKQLAEEATAVAAVQKGELLDAQKIHSRNMEKYSKQLVEALSKAVDINTQLRNACNCYVILKKQTGVEICSTAITQGSHGSLKELHDICAAEVGGQRQIRKPFTVGVTPL